MDYAAMPDANVSEPTQAELRREKVGVPSKNSGYRIEIFGRPAGVVVTDEGRFVFLAADPAFWNLDQRCFERIADAEAAVHGEWLRRQHRLRPGGRSNRRSG